MDDIYNSKQINFSTSYEEGMGSISEKEKFFTAKQILFGLAVLYFFTMISYLISPLQGQKLLDICTTTFPPLATLILAFYFRDHR